jgi:hypothetical protein
MIGDGCALYVQLISYLKYSQNPVSAKRVYRNIWRFIEVAVKCNNVTYSNYSSQAFMGSVGGLYIGVRPYRDGVGQGRLEERASRAAARCAKTSLER